MKLISINVAEPKVVLHHLRRVETGIFKKPVAGPVGVRFLNLEGDRQADLKVHGGPNKAVYAYSRENIEYWRERLGRDDLVPGTFGENLTVEELLETDVAIGDEFEIGTARLQVSQPRLPCFKLGFVMGRPDFVKTFQRSGKTGFYLRVLREGIIRAGDEIRRFPTADAEPVTVAEMVRIISGRKLSLADAHRALKLAALSDGWKRQISEKLAKYGSNSH
jgi:MOSC domain-containing protein YiiM